MDLSSHYQGNYIFRNQPPYTFFNKTFEEAKDALFLQIQEINPIFLTDAQLKDKTGFSQKILVDPRTKKEQTKIEYDHSLKGKRQKPFNGGGIKSALTKEEHKSGLRVLLAQQEHKELNEADLIVWRQIQAKLQKERSQMQVYIREVEETHKEDVYAPTKRLDELYKDWFTKMRASYAKSHPDNLAFNTHTGLPLVSLCKTINEDPIDIADVELLSKRGFVRLYDDEQNIDWQNLNFRLSYFAECCNESEEIVNKTELTKQISAELGSIDEKSSGHNFFIPLKTLLFLFTSGDIDLPTEVLLEIHNSNNKVDGKVITFDSPLPAHNCGYHTHQQVIEQSFPAFMSAKGRANWLTIDEDEAQVESDVDEVDVGGIDLTQYAPVEFDDYIAKNQILSKSIGSDLVKQNTALLKWYLRSPDLETGLKILTTLKLPPALNKGSKTLLAFEFIKLEYKPQFGCELFTKHELLKAWFQMRLMNFTATTDYGVCYRLSATDLSLQMKQRLTLKQIEHSLKEHYRINPHQLMTNLAEFLKLLCNMSAGKYMLRFNPKYSDKFLLCKTSQEIAQNTVFLHGLFEAEPTNLAWMTQEYFLPISDTLCGAVHLDNQILPCTFLPLLPGQKNLETADTKIEKRKKFLANITRNMHSVKEAEETKEQLKKRKNTQKRQRQKQRAKKAEVAAKENSDEEMLIV